MSDSETAYAKLNLALHVRGKREDGFHDIETVFAFCEDGDQLIGHAADRLSLVVGGPFGGALVNGYNLALQAAQRLQMSTTPPRGAAIHLDKRLPIASGIGGGSADAAAALRLLSRMWGTEDHVASLEPIAAKLGADVPACLHSTAMRASGRGDQLEPIDLGISGAPVMIINPRVELSTAEVFAGWDGIDRGPLEDWRHGRNDLEGSATRLAPQIHAVIAWLSAQRGASLVRMSGSGASCFAIFDSEEQRDSSAEAVPREWWRLTTRLR